MCAQLLFENNNSASVQSETPRLSSPFGVMPQMIRVSPCSGIIWAASESELISLAASVISCPDTDTSSCTMSVAHRQVWRQSHTVPVQSRGCQIQFARRLQQVTSQLGTSHSHHSVQAKRPWCLLLQCCRRWLLLRRQAWEYLSNHIQRFVSTCYITYVKLRKSCIAGTLHVCQ